MTSLSPTPVMVALVQTATTLPILFLALPAGALSDIVDRRRYLLIVQTWMALVAALLGILTITGVTTAWTLVALTFAMGIGSAMMMPAWAAITPEIVPRAELQSAVALNSMGMNVARAIGPAIAGIIVSTAGTGAVFALNALSFLGVMSVLFLWKRERAPTTLPAERFFSAVRTGVRFAVNHAPLQSAVIRGIGFFLFASASWALLPLIAREQLRGGPGTFGILVAGIGVGAVIGAVILPRLRAKLSKDLLVAGGTLLYSVAMLTLAHLTNLSVLILAMLVSGMAWITVLSSLQVAAQLALPNWVRSRGLAVFMATFMGSMALGSLVWGNVAQQTSIATALTIAATGGLLTIAITWRWKIGGIETIDLSPSMHWPTPMIRGDVSHDRGPVLIQILYRVAPESRAEFLAAVNELGKRRRRDGSFVWGVLENAEVENEFIEHFMVESWLDHLRQHERVTNEDRRLQEAIQHLLVAGTVPAISHFIASTD